MPEKRNKELEISKGDRPHVGLLLSKALTRQEEEGDGGVVVVYGSSHSEVGTMVRHISNLMELFISDHTVDTWSRGKSWGNKGMAEAMRAAATGEPIRTPDQKAKHLVDKGEIPAVIIYKDPFLKQMKGWLDTALEAQKNRVPFIIGIAKASPADVGGLVSVAALGPYAAVEILDSPGDPIEDAKLKEWQDKINETLTPPRSSEEAFVDESELLAPLLSSAAREARLWAFERINITGSD